MSTERQFCTFLIDDLLLGVRIEEVQELIRHQPTTIVPLSSSELGGLINLRGQIVIAIDLRRRLGLEPRADDESAMNVILRTEDGLVSLLVDEIGDVVEVSEDDFGQPPETLVASGRELIQSVVMLDKNLLLILDTEKAVNVDSALMNQ
ncbi:MAG: chemotaxis protein CheW [Acidobacteria bacterium]|nr:MAG: chemotaxis protein CheW [Acidobacteriota bacterium]